MLQARSAHAASAVKRFEDAMTDRAIAVRFDIAKVLADPNAKKGEDPDDFCKKVRHVALAPLGWYMTYQSARTTTHSANIEVERLCSTLELSCRH
jgi:hypothetical protein